MNYCIRFLILFIMLPCCLQAQEINWETDLEKAIEMATKQRKPLLLHCWFDGCGPCRKLDEYVFTNKDAIKAFNENVIPVKIDTITQREIAKRFDVKSVPHDIFLTPGGYNLLSRPSPRTVSEYVDVLKSARRLYETHDALVTGGLNHKPLEEELSEFGGHVRRKANSFTGQIGMQIDRSTGEIRQTANETSEELKKYDTSRFFQPSENGLPRAAQAQHVKTEGDPDNASVNPYVKKEVEVDQVAHQIQTPESKVVFNPFLKSNKKSAATDSTQQKMQIHNQQAAKQNPEPATNQFAAKPTVKQEKRFVAPPKPKTEVPAFGGFCSVTLQVERKWANGSADWGCYHRGRLFLFAKEEYLKQFVTNPDQFSPALAGYDPVIYAESGRLVEGKHQIGVFYPEKDPLIYVFANAESKKKFKESPRKFVETVRIATQECDSVDGSETSLR